MNAPVKKTPAAKVTPMMAQFLSIKEEVGPEVLLFYRMGDFYELFFDDAVKASEALDIALTKRGKHNGADIPMCGVPAHASETYLQRLIKKGFRVAVCEQTESPTDAKKRGYKAVVRRAVVRTVTPGTLTEDALLDARSSNFIVSVFQSPVGDVGLAWADISDGSFFCSQTNSQRLQSELAALTPREVILPEALYQTSEFITQNNLADIALTPLPGSKFNSRNNLQRLETVFAVKSLEGYGDFSKVELSAAGALVDYLELTQAGNPVRISPPKQRQVSGFMAIDPATRASLEIDKTQKGLRAGSLLSVMDRTVTGPGARLLAARLNQPLIDPEQINQRLDAVDYYIHENQKAHDIRDLIKGTSDLARSVSRLVLGRGGPRDLLNIGTALRVGEKVCAFFAAAQPPEKIHQALAHIDLTHKPELALLARDISKAFLPDAPLLARDGGFVAPGWSPELDELKKLRDDSRRVVASLQVSYAELAEIPSLKVKHNNVLGYFIEVTPKYADDMLSKGPESPFIHRQTLVSGVRFTTTELADLDSKIAGASDKAIALENKIFNGFVERIDMQAHPLRQAAQSLAELDVYTALAEWAQETGSVRPLVNDGYVFKIEGGRHPVVEASLKKSGSGNFTSNDCHLDAQGDVSARLTLITGPNMAGKSTYLRQNALMFILAQSGSYLPAIKAEIGIADSLFSRVGASDDLSKGRSTFMTEMIETAAILNLAGPRSFVILDEIGRGTATFDGLSIAWATAEHLHNINGSRALFATHYHELTDLMENLDAGSNACLHAKEWDGDLIFMHDVRAGAADKSYGVQVARLAGLPDAAVQRARDVLSRLESDHDNSQDKLGNLPLFAADPTRLEPKKSDVELILEALDPNDFSPRDALDFLYDLKAKLDKQ